MEFQIIWFVLWAVLWVVYFTLDGFDLGCGIVMNFISKNEDEKKAIISSIGPLWNGNEVWLITAGGASFAAFPQAYAFMFSWFYIPLFLVLIGLILRGISVELRNKSDYTRLWDILIFIGSFLPSFLFGVFFTNLWKGVSVDSNGYTDGLYGLINFYGIYGGLFFVSLFILHALIWLYYRIDGEMKLKVYKYSKLGWYVVVFMFAFFILFLPQRKNPSFDYKNINYYFTIIFYALSFISMLFLKKSLEKGVEKMAFISSVGSVFFFMAAGFSSQYPYLIPFSTGSGISIFSSSSSPSTLKIMTLVVLIFMPLVIAYQLWVYKIFSTKIIPGKDRDILY